MIKKVGIVYNPKAGSGASASDIKSAFKPGTAHLTFIDIKMGNTKIINKARQNKVQIMVAAGGDGTVNTAAQVAIKLGLPLGVLPLGTLNHLAKDVGVPEDLKDAAAIITKGRTKKIDYGTVKEKVFLNNSSIGIYPATVTRRSRIESKFGKWPSAAFAVIHTIAKVNTLSATVHIGERTFRTKTPMLFIGNNSYDHEKVGLAERSNLDKGELFLYIVKANRPRAVVRAFISFLAGKRLRSKDITTTTSKDIKVELNRELVNVSLDGEVIKLKPPLLYQSHQKALTIISK